MRVNLFAEIGWQVSEFTLCVVMSMKITHRFVVKTPHSSGRAEGTYEDTCAFKCTYKTSVTQFILWKMEYNH